MSSQSTSQVTFEIDRVIQPIYTGGDVSINQDGRVLATCVEEEALLTNPDTGDALCRIEGDGEILTSLQITPSASHLVACSRSLSMRIYSLERQEESDQIQATLLRTLKPHTTPVVCATIDRTGTLLATGGADSSIKVWDIRGGFATHTFRGHSGIISALRFFETRDGGSETKATKSAKSKKRKSDADQDMIMLDDSIQQQDETNATFRLASGGDDGKIRIWDLVKRKSVALLDSHVSVVRGLDYSLEQDALVSSSRDRTLILWDAKSWKPRKVIPALEVLEVSLFVHGGKFICTGGEKGCIRVWATELGREVTDEQEAGGDADAIVSLLPSRNNTLMSVHADQSLVLHELDPLLSLEKGETIEELPELRRISGTHDEVIDLAYVTPRRELLALATNSESIRLVSLGLSNAPQDEKTRYFGADVALLEGHDEIIICLAVDWSGCWMATGAKDNSAKLWRLDHENQDYSCYATFTGHAESLGAIALPTSTPQPESAAFQDPLSHPPAFIITGSQDKTIKRWTVTGKGDKKAPKAVYTRRAHDKDINAIATNYSSSLFASASQDRTVKIWSVEEGEVQGMLQGHKRGVWSVQFAPKDTPSISGEESRATSSRGIILTGAGDKTVKIWSLSDYTCLRTLEGHTNSVLKVLWLPPRKAAETKQVDDMDEGEDTGRPKIQAQSSRSDHVLIASAGGDGLVKIWDAQSGESATVLDNHTDRIWALAAHPTDGTLISGGGDSVVTFWKDTTSATATAKAKTATQRVEQEQELLNHVHHGNYREAIVLALTLNHPGRLLALFTNVTKKSPPESGSLSGLKAVDEVIAKLSDDQLFKLLLRIRDWSTNARTAPVAQRILWVIVKSYPANRLIELGKGKGRRGLRDVIASIQAYTERHYRRMEELLEESYIVDFVVRGMGEEGFVGTNGIAEHEQDTIMVE